MANVADKLRAKRIEKEGEKPMPVKPAERKKSVTKEQVKARKVQYNEQMKKLAEYKLNLA